jgi:hypothetical protein
VLCVQAGEVAMQPVAQAVELKGLKIHLGPELRAMFPVVLNMSISGDIELNGAADPASLKLAGIIHLDGGEVGRETCIIFFCFGVDSTISFWHIMCIRNLFPTQSSASGRRLAVSHFFAVLELPWSPSGLLAFTIGASTSESGLPDGAAEYFLGQSCSRQMPVSSLIPYCATPRSRIGLGHCLF